jgi:hypothetical protein
VVPWKKFKSLKGIKREEFGNLVTRTLCSGAQACPYCMTKGRNVKAFKHEA